MPKKETDKEKLKAQKAAEKAAKLEAERLAAEAERQRREEEERLRAEAEAERQENLRIYRQQEQDRLKSERESDVELLRKRNSELGSINALRQRNLEWQAHLECSHLPPSESDADLNTYIAILEQEPSTSLSQAVAIAQDCENIVHRLDHIWASALEDRQPLKIARCIEFGARVRAAANQQVDAATALSPLIVDAESHDDSKIAEFQEAHASSDLRLGLWVRATPAAQQGTRLKPIVFKELGISLELPKTLATLSSGNQFTTLALRVIHLLNDPFSILNQGSYLSLGGVVMLQFLGVLPPPLYIREWTVKEVTPQSQTLQLKPYPGPPDSGGTVQTIRISYSLPKNLLLQAENLQLAVFEDNEWKIDPLTITDAKYTNNTTAPAGTTTGASANERTISFLLMANRLAPMALVQQRALDFPYQKWAIIPLSWNKCQLQLTGSRFTVVFDICDDFVSLSYPIVPELSDFLHRPMRPGQLLRALATAGLLLLPDDRDAVLLQRQTKSVHVESKIHDQIAQLMPHFEVRDCELNSVGGTDRLFYQVRPCSESRRSEYSRSLQASRDALEAAALHQELQQPPPSEAPVDGDELPEPVAEQPKKTLGLIAPHGDEGGVWRSALHNEEKCWLFKSNVKTHKAPEKLQVDADGGDEPQKSSRQTPKSTKRSKAEKAAEKAEKEKAEKEKAEKEAAEQQANADSEPVEVITYIPASQISQINDEWQFELSHVDALRCANKLAEGREEDADEVNVRTQDTLRRLLNLVRPFSFDQLSV